MSKTKILTSLPDSKEHSLAVTREDGTFRVAKAASGEKAALPPDGRDVDLAALVIPRGADVFTVVVDGASYEAMVEQDEGEYSVQVGPERYLFRTGGDASSGAHKSRGGGRHELKAPMPGKVVKMLVEVGQEVAAGQGVVLFEAMKMQNEIRSPGDGTVAELHVAEGAAVEAKAPLLAIQLS